MTTREKNRQRLFEFLITQKCKDCNESDLRVLTFDHRDRNKKKATISSMIHDALPWSEVQKELKKVDCVCHNCHVKRECIRDNSARQQFWEELNGE